MNDDEPRSSTLSQILQTLPPLLNGHFVDKWQVEKHRAFVHKVLLGSPVDQPKGQISNLHGTNVANILAKHLRHRIDIHVSGRNLLQEPLA